MPGIPNKCGSCACESCEIFSDDYSTDQLATAYSTRSGSWAVSGGDLDCTSASALVVCNTAVTAGFNGVYATAKITCATTNDIGRLVIGYVDDNNYWFLEIKPGASDGTLKVFQRSGGADTQKGTTQTITGFSANEQLQVYLCYSSNVVLAVAGNKSVATYSTISIASTKCGIGTGAGSSSVSFDDFSFSKHDVDDVACPQCDPPCSPCNDTFPDTIEVTLPSNMYGAEGSIPNCVTTACCETLNGQTVVLARNPDATILGASSSCAPDFDRNCLWSYVAPSDFCADQGCGSGTKQAVYAGFRFTGTSNIWELQVVVGTGPGTGLETAHRFRLTINGAISCVGTFNVPYTDAMVSCTSGESCLPTGTPNDVVVDM